MKVKTESDVMISREARESIMPRADMYGDIPEDRRCLQWLFVSGALWVTRAFWQV